MKNEESKKKNEVPQARVEKSDVAKREEEVLAFWNQNDIFKKSVETPAGSAPVGDFVFYDGPPFATGLPHYGHLLPGTIKDAIPRFWTMNGYRVKRRWGWDCHGLPLENIIEKRLGLATKRDIEAMGVKQFNEAAREAVLEYADDWKRIVPRMGRFVDMEDDYRTMDATYTESVWWVFAELNKKGLVYEGFKSMHLCPRCGTTLSNFEVNQGYKDIKDIAVTVKLPLLNEVGTKTDTSLLVWTTTPWTLPGNMAAAVHKDIEYVKVRCTLEDRSETVILAKERLAQLGTEQYEVLETMKGSVLVGKRYEPPFDTFKEQEFSGKEKAWTIYHADYVELGEEGTGAVHLAPAYGEEDMELAKREGVPVVHHVDTDGRFKDFVTHFAGQLVKPKDDEKSEVSHLDADIEVVKRLKDTGALLRKENITHSYPHCWRCDTPLLNYATTSWFVRVTDIKDKLIEANAQVGWVPEHVGKNRFGKWLENARDWAISRQRYWGAPLPIWRREGSGEYKVFSSLADLQAYVPKRGNRYFIARHAEAESNLNGTINALPGSQNGLTENGKAQCLEMANQLRGAGITKIVHSGLERARETAHEVATHLGLSPTSVVEDARIVEYQVGKDWEGKTWKEFNANFANEAEKFEKHLPGVERRRDLIKRTGDFLYEFDSTHQNETTLIIGHGSSVFALFCVAEGANMERTIALKEAGYLKNAEVRPLPFVQVPHNDFYELDFHRPYIDEIELRDTDGTRLVRVPDVFDCWFESGSMPYGQHHYPFEHTDTFDVAKRVGFPAQFIAESIDQTRGWFYSMLVLGVALSDTSSYEHVITTGLVLAEDGRKMSKSLQNYPDLLELTGRVGMDAIRYYLLSSPIIKGEDLNFSEKEITEQQRKNLGRLHNVLAMYEMYADGTSAHTESTHVLDRWIIARLNQATADITEGYKSYELDRATRPIADLIDDLSVWYLRRSRDRLKSDDGTDKVAALATLRHTLKTLALLMAPVMPFYAEYLFLRVREQEDVESVHLMAWPELRTPDSTVMLAMTSVRETISELLELRMKANVKVRQPLSAVRINYAMGDEYKALLKEELNVKEVIVDTSISSSELDLSITPELKREGDVRELMRRIQDTRKEMALVPEDRIILIVSEGLRTLMGQFEDEVVRTTGVDVIKIGEGDLTITIDGISYTFAVVKKGN